MHTTNSLRRLIHSGAYEALYESVSQKILHSALIDVTIDVLLLMVVALRHIKQDV